MAKIPLELRYKVKMVLAKKRGDTDVYNKFRRKLENIKNNNQPN